ncbi:MAG: hypothetical protein JXB46_03640 [Candidatus Eisenbacteria bacterium]|nr:hypothetical protein [Candidatus Eisenbacteria bacterium]
MSERTGPSGRPLAVAVATALSIVLMAAVATGASELRVEAESFEPYGSYDIGGYPIEVAYCSYASGALAVDGLDVMSEWFKLKVTFEIGGCYESRLDYQSDYGDTVDLAVRLLDYPAVGDELRADYQLINGYGFG